MRSLCYSWATCKITWLIQKYQSLQCTTAPNGWEAWAHAIAFKIGNFHNKMRRRGCEEVQINGGKRSKFSRPDAPPPASNIKKDKKGKVNLMPNLPAADTVDSLELHRTCMVLVMKSTPDLATINHFMSLTFASCRKEVTQILSLTCVTMQWWHELFTSSQVKILSNPFFNYSHYAMKVNTLPRR